MSRNIYRIYRNSKKGKTGDSSNKIMRFGAEALYYYIKILRV
jgi:hypothetical protein